jgi:hypothetical protein
MDKATFIAFLQKNRRESKEENDDANFLDITPADDELMWRIYQVFPSDWDEVDRYSGTTVLICHMVLFAIALIEKDLTISEAASELYDNLKLEFGFHIGKKHLHRFVETVKIISEKNED